METKTRTKKKTESNGAAGAVLPVVTPRSLVIAKEGIDTSPQLARYLSAVISDVTEGVLPPLVANAGVNAAGKLMKIVELQHKYGTPGGNGKRILRLCDLTEKPEAEAPLAPEQPSPKDGRWAEIAALKERLAELEADQAEAEAAP
jgi:hypothetical protein